MMNSETGITGSKTRYPNKDLPERTLQFGIRVIHLVDSLPRKKSATIIGNQLLRSATPVGANYHSACRGKSRADFIAKLAIAIEEADESLYWLKMLLAAQLVPESKIYKLIDEANQLVSILTTSSKTAKQNMHEHS